MSLLRKLTGLLGLTKADPQQHLQAIDLWSAEDRSITERAHAGESLGPENEPLVSELIEMGAGDEFITVDQCNMNVHNPRAKEIGRILASRGGKPLMRSAYYRVEAKCGSTLASHLSSVWNGIGGWMS